MIISGFIDSFSIKIIKRNGPEKNIIVKVVYYLKNNIIYLQYMRNNNIIENDIKNTN